MRPVTSARGHRTADSLKLELGVAILFWLPYILPDGFLLPGPDSVGLAYAAAWFASPILTLLGLIMVPRDLKLRWGRVQVLIAMGLAASIWLQFRTIEFC